MNLLSTAWRREDGAAFWRAGKMNGFKGEEGKFIQVDPLLIKSESHGCEGLLKVSKYSAACFINKS